MGDGEVAVGVRALQRVYLHALLAPVLFRRRKPRPRPNEAQEERALLRGELLQNAPQDPDVRRVGVYRHPVACILPQLVQINVGCAAHHELNLAMGE